MRSIAYYWKEGLRNIFKHGFMSVAAVVIMVVSLLLTGTVTLVAYNITNNITRLQQSNQIEVWIDDSLTTREAKTLQTQADSDSARVQHDRGSYDRRSGCYLDLHHLQYGKAGHVCPP